MLVALIAAAALAPVLSHASPIAENPVLVFHGPSAAHPMGTDDLGRDMLARVLYGGRYTIGASLIAIAVGGAIGSLLGLVAATSGSMAELLIMRLMDLLLVFPGVLLALCITTLLGPGLSNAIWAIAISQVPVFARVVEGATLEVRSAAFIEAAVSAGASRWRLMFAHIVPNVLSKIIVLATTGLGVAALAIAALGFLGLGVQPPVPEWGEILSDGKDFISLAWWITVFPGACLTIFVIGANLLGDGLRDLLDPTERGR